MSLTPATAGGASFRTVEIQDRTVSSVTTDESGRLVSIVSNRGIELCHCNTLFSSGGATKDLQFIPVITVKGTGTANASLVTSMCVEWNPSRKMKEYFATTAPNSRVLLWKVGAQIQQSPTVVGQISAARIPSKTTIASLSWSLPEPSIFVTCAGRNSDVTVWNFEALSSQKGVVMRKPISASVVSCNKINRSIFASGHDNGEIRIWDTKTSKDINFIMAHRSKLLSVGWSPIDENVLLTSSVEKDAKVWDLRKPLTPLFTISYDQLPTKAVFTSTGTGVAVSYQSLNVVNVWAFNNLSKPLYQLKDPSCSHVVSFDLRRCEPESSDYDVITCYKNKTLGLWKVPQHVRAKLLEPCDVNSVKVTKTQATSTTQQDELDSEFEQVYDSTKLSKFLSSADRAKRVCVLLWEGKPKQSSKAAERQQQQRNQQAQEDVSQDIYNTESSTSQQFNGTLYQVKVKVSFPSIYPKAIASFEIIRQITPNDTQESNAILGSLKKKAHECAIYGKGCLVSVIEELDRVCSKLVETVKVPLPAPTQPMPCPRFSGCCFSPSGEFVYFVQSRGTRMEKCPRTYQDFLEQIKNPQNLPQSKFSIKPNSKNSSGAGSGGGNSGTSSCDGSGIFSGTHGTKPPGAGTSSDPNSGKNSFSSRPGASVSDGSSSDVCSSAEDNNSKMTYYKAAALYYSQQQMFQPDAVQENVNRSPLPDFASTVTQVNEKRAEVNPVHFVSSVWRTCFDFIMPFSPELARGYVLRGSSVKEVCRANEAVARRLGRMDLASMWSILSLLLDPEANTDKGKRSMLNFNWIRRPIGMKMVEEVFNKAISNKDVQTLGILACVLILYSKETNMQNIPVRDTKPGDSSQHEVEPNVSSSRGMVSPTLMSATPTTAPSFGPNSHDGYPLLSPISLRGFAPSSKLSHSPLSSSPVDGTRQQMPSLALREGASHSKRPSRTNCTVNNPALGGSIGCIHVARKVPINKSMDGGGCTGVSPTNSGVYINKSQMEGRPLKLLLSNASVSSEPLQKQGPHIFLEEYPRFMHSYATLLYKWGLFYEMKMIHDFIDLYNEMYSKYGSFSPRQDPQARSCLSSSSSSSFPSISSSLSSSLPVKEIGPYSVVIKRDPVCLCFNCKTPCSSYACPNCARIVLRCSICHSSVKGLSWYCTSCLHGGHLGHMSKWFEDNEVCPTGCGCRCKENAYKQDTSEGSFPMENLPFEDVRPSVPTNSSQQTQTETGSPTLANSLTTLVSSELQQ